MSLKDLRQDPVNTNAYFKLREQNSDMLKVFYEMDRPIRVAVSFMSQQQIINKPSISAHKNMIVKALEYQTAQ